MAKKKTMTRTKSNKNPPKVSTSGKNSLWNRMLDDEKTEKLIIFMQLNPTGKEVASFMGISQSTLNLWLQKHFQCNFEAFKSFHLTDVKLRLTSKAISMAEKGNPAILKFALQNLCDWTEKSKIDGTQLALLLGEVQNLTEEELDEEYRKLANNE